MRHPEHNDKVGAVIQAFLALLNRRASRTQIVKLVYLADNLCYESTGKTITDTRYMWDHYGPNAVDNSIADATDELVAEGQICRAVGLYKGSHTYNYWVFDSCAIWRKIASVLSDVECQIVQDIARKYGRYNASDLANMSKKTKPFENAKQYEILRFKQSERTKEVQDMLDASPDFLNEVRLGFEDLEAGRWVWADEVDNRSY